MYCRLPGLQSPAFPISSHHTCHSRRAISSCLDTGNLHVPLHPSEDGPLCEGRRSREQKHHISRCGSPGRNTAAFIPHTHLHGTLGFQCVHNTTDKFRLSKSTQHFQQASSNYTHSAGRCWASPCTAAPPALADLLPVIQKSRYIFKKYLEKSSILLKPQSYPKI